MIDPKIKMYIVSGGKRISIGQEPAKQDVELDNRYHLSDRDDRYDIYIEMPGAEKDALKIYARENLIRVSGETKKDLPYRRRYSFKIDLDEPIDPDRVKAKYEDGVLVITAFKREAMRRIPID